MKTQFDHQVRIVSLENLRAMCERASGMSHRYEVSKVSRSRAHVVYSNPNEYGTEQPITAVFPCYPSTFDGDDNPAIVLNCTRIIGATADDYDPIQYFDAIVCSPALYRANGEWKTREQIDGTDRYLCPDGQIRTVDRSHPYTNDTFAAFDITTETSSETFALIGGTRHFAYFTWTTLKPVR